MTVIAWTAALAAAGLFALLLIVDERAALASAPLVSAVLVIAWAFLLAHHERTHRRDRTR